MSEAQTNPVVVRNNVPFTFTPTTTGKKHSKPGMSYFMPLLKPGQLQNDPNALAWFGDLVEPVMNRTMRAIYADMAIEHTDENGVFNLESWLLAASEPNAGRSKIADLESELDVQVDIVAAMTDKVFNLVEKEGTEEEQAAWKFEADKVQEEAQGIIRNVIKPLRKKIVEIKDKYEKIVAARAAKPVAAEATAA